MQIGITGPGQGYAMVKLWGQKVKDQCHMRLKLNVEVWQRYCSRPTESVRQKHTINIGNVAVERVWGCSTVLTAPAVWRRVSCCAMHLFVSLFISSRL